MNLVYVFKVVAATPNSRGWSQCKVCQGYQEWAHDEPERFNHHQNCPVGQLEQQLADADVARQQAEQRVEELLTIKVVDYSDDVGARLTVVEQALSTLVTAWDTGADEQLEHALAAARIAIDRERG